VTSAPGVAAEQFAVDGSIVSVAPLGDGHINETHEIRTDSGRRYVLQRINRAVFRDPEAVMRNVDRVVRHLVGKVAADRGDVTREVLTLIPSRDGAVAFRDREGETWRCYVFVEGVTAHSAGIDAARAHAVGAAFGRFLRRVSDLPPDEVEVTIPGFHDPARHLAALRGAVRSDRCGRRGRATPEIALIEARGEDTERWSERLGPDGGFPTRVVHNDTKVSNVLVDDRTGRGACVIDLDTVMPGSAVIDMADCARSALTRALRPGGDPAIFEAVLRGFLSEAGEGLVEPELEALVDATRVIALELGTRFLTDFLTGDRWFPAAEVEENLDRCRGQLRIAQWVEQNEAALRTIAHRAARGRKERRAPSTGGRYGSESTEGKGPHDPR